MQNSFDVTISWTNEMAQALGYSTPKTRTRRDKVQEKIDATTVTVKILKGRGNDKPNKKR